MYGPAFRGFCGTASYDCVISAPVSLAVLNPIGFVLMEIGRNNDNNNDKWKIFTKVIYQSKYIYIPTIYYDIRTEFGNKPGLIIGNMVVNDRGWLIRSFCRKMESTKNTN